MVHISAKRSRNASGGTFAELGEGVELLDVRLVLVAETGSGGLSLSAQGIGNKLRN